MLTSKKINLLLLSFYLPICLLWMYQATNNFHWYSFDHFGHMASFLRMNTHHWKLFSGMHGFNPLSFLGSTDFLFYPPLEASLISAIFHVLRLCNLWEIAQPQLIVYAFQIYLYLVVIFFFGSLYYLNLVLTRYKPHFIFVMGSAFMFLYITHIDKLGVLKLQGLSFHDLIVIGLTNQFLAMGFVFIALGCIIRSLCYSSGQLRTLHWWTLALCSLATVLSHLVVGLLVVMILSIYIFMRIYELPSTRNVKKVLLPFAVVVLLSAFFTFPFLIYQSYLTSSLIFAEPLTWASIASAIIFLLMCGIIVKRRKELVRSDIFILFMLGAAVLFFALNTLPQNIKWLREMMPSFHYYRLGIFGYYIMITTLLFTITFYRNHAKTLTVIFAVLILHLFLHAPAIAPHHLLVKHAAFVKPELEQNIDHLFHKSEGDPSFSRVLSLGHNRSAESSFDEFLKILNPTIQSAKGLFWESSYTNSLINSYLATLQEPPVVLDYFYYYNYSCERLKCFLDDVFDLYNVGTFIGNPSYFATNTKRKMCYLDIIKNGTDHFTFHKTGQLSYGSQLRPVYRIHGDSKNNYPVKIVDNDQLYTHSPASSYFMAKQVLKRTDTSCKSMDSNIKRVAYMPNQQRNFRELKDFYLARHSFHSESYSTVSSVGYDLVSSTDGSDQWTYKVILPDDNWYLFLLKLAPQPGVEIIHADSKQSVPIVDGYPHMISVGKGEMHIRISKTSSMIWSHRVSAITLGLLVLWMIVNLSRRFMGTRQLTTGC